MQKSCKCMVYFKASPLSNQVIVAAATVASWFPTPTPLREAWVAKVPDRELEKAWEREWAVCGWKSQSDSDDNIFLVHYSLYLHSIPKLVLQVIAADTLWISLRQKNTLKKSVKMWVWRGVFVFEQSMQPQGNVLNPYFKYSNNRFPPWFTLAPISSPLHNAILSKILPGFCTAISLCGQNHTSVSLHLSLQERKHRVSH